MPGSANTTPPTVVVDTGNPALNSLIQRGLLLATGGITVWITAWLSAKGWYDPNFGWLITVAVFGFLSAIAVLIWGWIKNSRLKDFIDQVQRTAVMAGVNLTASGNAVTVGGNPIVAHVANSGAGTETPKPVSVAAAKEIVADFAERRVAVKPKS